MKKNYRKFNLMVLLIILFSIVMTGWRKYCKACKTKHQK